MSDSWKLKREMAASGLSAWFRRLADALEGEPDAELAGLPVADCRKLVLVAERKDHGLEVRLKAKRAGEVLAPASWPGKGRDAMKPESAKPEFAKADPSRTDPAKKDPAKKDPVKKEKYRQLKKRMQADAKVLERAVRAGILPAEETLESFLSLAEIMVEMDAALHGDAEMKSAGAAFLADALTLREAFQRHDVEALAEVLGRLDRRRSACHAQFK